MSVLTYVVGMSKPLVWLHGEVKSPPFSASARVEAGFLLRMLQEGERLGMPESRPMPAIGSGCHELRKEARWRVGSGLDEVESQFVEIKLALARLLRTTRTRLRLTQLELAQKLGSSQSRVAKREAGDPTATVDLSCGRFWRLGRARANWQRRSQSSADRDS